MTKASCVTLLAGTGGSLAGAISRAGGFAGGPRIAPGAAACSRLGITDPSIGTRGRGTDAVGREATAVPFPPFITYTGTRGADAVTRTGRLAPVCRQVARGGAGARALGAASIHTGHSLAGVCVFTD